jgi:hypothetical protein
MVAMVAQDCMISANVHDDRCRMDHGIAECIEARLPRAKAATLLTHRQGNGVEKIAFAVANEFNDELGQHPHDRVIPVNELEVG